MGEKFLAVYWAVSFIILFVPHIVCSLFIEKRKYVMFRMPAAFLICSLLAGFIALNMRELYLITNIFGLLIILFVNKLSLKELIYYNVWCVIFSSLIQQIAATIGDMISPENILAGMPIGKLIAVIVVIALETVTFRFLKDKSIVKMRWEHILLSVIISSSVIILNSICFNFLSKKPVSLYLFQLFSVLSVILALYLQIVIIEHQKRNREAEFMRHLWYAHKHAYEMKKEYIDIINRKYHDLKHEIAALQQMHTCERLEKLNVLEKTIDQYDSMIQTGNSILDTILNEKRIQCLKNDIQLVCMVESIDISFIDIIDLSILLGNALDNSIEAVKKLSGADRKIDFKMYKDRNFIRFTIINPYMGTLIFNEKLPVSTKKDSLFHGFGIKSIKSIVNKYSGDMVIDISERQFKLNMILLIPD